MLFKQEFEQTSATGTLHPAVHGLYTAIAKTWEPDSQSVEGINSRIKYKTTIAHNIQIDALNADIAVNNMLGLGTKDAPTNVDVVQPRVKALLNQAAIGYDKAEIDDVLRGPDACMPIMDQTSSSSSLVSRDSAPMKVRQSRWAPPPPDFDMPTTVSSQASHNSSFRSLWVGACSLRWYRKFEPFIGNYLLKCYTVGPDVWSRDAASMCYTERQQTQAGLKYSCAYITPTGNHFVGHSVVLSISDMKLDGPNSSAGLALLEPLQFVSTSEAMGSLQVLIFPLVRFVRQRKSHILNKVR